MLFHFWIRLLWPVYSITAVVKIPANCEAFHLYAIRSASILIVITGSGRFEVFQFHQPADPVSDQQTKKISSSDSSEQSHVVYAGSVNQLMWVLLSMGNVFIMRQSKCLNDCTFEIVSLIGVSPTVWHLFLISTNLSNHFTAQHTLRDWPLSLSLSILIYLWNSSQERTPTQRGKFSQSRQCSLRERAPCCIIYIEFDNLYLLMISLDLSLSQFNLTQVSLTL